MQACDQLFELGKRRVRNIHAAIIAMTAHNSDH